MSTPGQLDGEGYQFVDIDNDGAKELVNFDPTPSSTLSGSYAGSYAPTRITKLSGSDLNDVTNEPKYRIFLRRKLPGTWRPTRRRILTSGTQTASS